MDKNMQKLLKIFFGLTVNICSVADVAYISRVVIEMYWRCKYLQCRFYAFLDDKFWNTMDLFIWSKYDYHSNISNTS